MIRALGKTITLEAGQSLTKHDFYLPLSDVLLDLVEQDLYGPSAKSASLLGCSLAHDFIRLSTVAGQLLWFVETTPVRIGTPDLLSITMLAESYLMSLRSACDVIAVIIHTFCIEDKKRGQVPDESFNDLIDWIENNPNRVPESIKFVVEHREWFVELRSIRDKLVHPRFDINIFMNGVFPSFSLMSTGDLHLHFLRKPGQFHALLGFAHHGENLPCESNSGRCGQRHGPLRLVPTRGRSEEALRNKLQSCLRLDRLPRPKVDRTFLSAWS